eukprot:2410904-Pyramimonas_sp.AAC.1
MNANSRATYGSGLCNICMQVVLLSACVAELSAPGLSATDKEIVEKVIRNTDPLHGRGGTNMAGVLLYVIGITFACPVSSDTVARSDWGAIEGRRHRRALISLPPTHHHQIIMCSEIVSLKGSR